MTAQTRGHDGLSGIARIVRALHVGRHALVWAWKDEEALRLEIVACVVALPLALWLGANGVERALLWGSVVLVFIVELLNTAVEVVVDRISLERHPLSGLAKDLGSLAVGVSVLLAGATWTFVLL